MNYILKIFIYTKRKILRLLSVRSDEYFFSRGHLGFPVGNHKTWICLRMALAHGYLINLYQNDNRIRNTDLLAQQVEELKKEDDEETALEREFVKVEKEMDSEAKSTPAEQSISSEVKSKEFESLTKELKNAESEKTLLQEKLSTANEILQKSNKRCEELETDLKKLKEEMEEQALKDLAQKKELISVKEASEKLSLELQNSKEKVEKLELDLSSSAKDLRIFEELSKEKEQLANSESKKASEFEKLLEAAKLNAEEMEKKMTLLQEELKNLEKTGVELSSVTEELERSKTQVLDLKVKAESEGKLIQDLTEELTSLKASEKQLRDELTTKESALKQNEQSLEEKVKRIEAQESHVLSVSEELKKTSKEKEALEKHIGELTGNVNQLKELHSVVENKLTLSESTKTELQVKIVSLEEELKGSVTKADVASQKHVELTALVETLNVDLNRAKDSLKETELKLASIEERNVELSKQLDLSESKSRDGEEERKKLQGKISELSDLLKAAEEESALSACHSQAYQDRITHLESSAEKSSALKERLELELKELAEKLAERETQSSATQVRIVQLEEEVNVSSTKVEDSLKRISELELLLETTKTRNQELDDLVNQKSSLVADLSTELNSSKVKSSELEAALEVLSRKEGEYIGKLNALTEEKTRLENLAKITGEKQLEAEHLIESLKAELNSVNEKHQILEKDLVVYSVREKEILEKLKDSEEQVDHHVKSAEKAAARSLELESLHESVTKDSEKKLQEAISKFEEKEAEAKLLNEKSKNLEVQVAAQLEELASFKSQTEDSSKRISEIEQLLEITKSHNQELDDVIIQKSALVVDLSEEIKAFKVKSSNLEAALEASNKKETEYIEKLNAMEEELTKFHNLTIIAGEKQQEAENMIKTLKDELNSEKEKLEAMEKDLEASSVREKEIMDKLKSSEDQIDHHVKSVDKATARSLELESLHESATKDAEKKLQEVISKLEEKDSEVQLLNEKLKNNERKETAQLEELTAFKTQLEDSAKRINDLEANLERTKNHSQELEDVISQKSALIIDLSAEIEDFKVKSTDLEEENKILYIKKKEYEDLLLTAGAQQMYNEDLIHNLKTELGFHLEEIRNLEKDLEALSLREKEIIEKLDNQAREAEATRARSLELESLHESSTKDSERKLQDAILKFEEKDSEAKLLNEKLENLEKQAAAQIEELVFFKTQLEESSKIIASLESVAEDLKAKISDSEITSAKMVDDNNKLKEEIEVYGLKINDLHAEKNSTAEQLAAHLKSMDELRDHLSRTTELHSEAESRSKEAQLLISQRDSEKQELKEKIKELEVKIESYVASADAQKVDLDAALIKLKSTEEIIEVDKANYLRLESENERLVQTNLKVTEELAALEKKINDLQTRLGTVLEDNEKTSMELSHLKKANEELTVSLDSECKKLQDQVSLPEPSLSLSFSLHTHLYI